MFVIAIFWIMCGNEHIVNLDGLCEMNILRYWNNCVKYSEMDFCVNFEFVLWKFWNNNKLLPTMDNFDISRRKFCVLCYFHFRWKSC